MNGILLVDKPKGWTSFDVVNKVRRIVQVSPLNTSNKKRFPVGHTGTLDPLATGLLVLLLGKYTTHAPRLTKFDKTYEVTMKLGYTSTTGDEEGDKTATSDRVPSIKEVQAAFAELTGEIMQIPPIYSAIKINGQRAYKLAREGKAPEMQPRSARIDYITITDYTYPIVRFTTHVSSGTYIRTLVEDAGAALKTGAYMADLRRTAVGGFQLADAIVMDGITAEKVQAALKEV